MNADQTPGAAMVAAEAPLPATVLEHANCPMHCPPGDDPVLTGSDRLSGLPGRFAVRRCRGCGVMRTDPRPDRASIGAYYPDSYGPYQGTRIAARAGRHPLAMLKRAAHAVFRFRLTALPPVTPPGRALEVGCASGSYLQVLRDRGWEVEGIEFSPQAATRAQQAGFRVHAGTLEDAPERDGQYDLVVAWMVLEHLHDPVDGLRKLLRWTRPGGWLALSVPNAGSAEFRWFGPDWYALQLPTHLTHFTPATLTAMLARAGWSPQRVLHQRTLSNLVCSIGYRLQDAGFDRAGTRLVAAGERSALLQYLLYPAAAVAAAFGQTGRMCAWARRIE